MTMETKEQEEWDDVLRRMLESKDNLVCVFRQLEPELLVQDLVSALKKRIDSISMNRMKLPMSNAVLFSIQSWRWCLKVQPPILFNKRVLWNVIMKVMTTVDPLLSDEKIENALAATGKPLSSSPSPIKFIITGQLGDGKTLTAAILCLYLQDHFKNNNVTSSIIIPLFPSATRLQPHASDVLRSINAQLRERLPSSFRRHVPPHSSMHNLRCDFMYYTSTLISLFPNIVIVIVIDDAHLLSHSVSCVDETTMGYFIPHDLSQRVITIVTCNTSHLTWLQQHSLAPDPACIITLKQKSDERVGFISIFAARHLKPWSQAQSHVMRSLAVPEDRDEFIRDSQHFRSVFAVSADSDAAYCAALDRAIALMPKDYQIMRKRLEDGAAFAKWFGTENDVPDGGVGNALVFSHSSMVYVRGCCAALESLTPADDVGTVTIVKKLLDAGLADQCLTDDVSFGNCVITLLKAACSMISKCAVAIFHVALIACAPLAPQEVAEILTLDGVSIGELDASSASYSVRQFPLRVVHDVVGYLSILGIECLQDDESGVLVAPLRIKSLMLQWAASQGFKELDAHKAIANYFLRDSSASFAEDNSSIRSSIILTDQPLLYQLSNLEVGEEEGDRLTACNERRLVIGCTSSMLCGNLAAAGRDLLNSTLHVNAFEQGLGYVLINNISSLLMIQSSLISSSSTTKVDSSHHLHLPTISAVSPPNFSISTFLTWRRLHPRPSETCRALIDDQFSAAQQFFAFLMTHFVTLCEQPGRMASLATTMASSVGNVVFDASLSMSSSQSSSSSLSLPSWKSNCLCVHVPSFDAVSSIRATICSKLTNPAVRFRLNSAHGSVSSGFSSHVFVADGDGVCTCVAMEPPFVRTAFTSLHCSKVISLDWDSSTSSLYVLILKEMPRTDRFHQVHQKKEDSEKVSIASSSATNREGSFPQVGFHPGDFLFKAREKHTRPNTDDHAEDFVGFVALETTLQLLRCPIGSVTMQQSPQVLLNATAAGNFVHSLVLSNERSTGNVLIIFGAKQFSPEFELLCKGKGITLFSSSITLAHDDEGCTIAAASPLRITLHVRGEGSGAIFWSKSVVELSHNAQLCAVSPDGHCLAVLLSNSVVALYFKTTVTGQWYFRGKCVPQPCAGLRALAVTRISSPSAIGGSTDSSIEDALVGISSAQGVVQVWHFAAQLTSAVQSSLSASATIQSSISSHRNAAALPRRGSLISADETCFSLQAQMTPLLCGLHSIGACAARDDLPLAFFRRTSGSFNSMSVVAADSNGTLRIFDVRSNLLVNAEGTDEVVMISTRSAQKKVQMTPAVGHAVSVVTFQLLPPSNIMTLDMDGMIMMHSARTSSLIASSDGLDITRVECFVVREFVAIGSALTLSHPMNFSQVQSFMFTGGSDGSLRAFDKDFVCYWQASIINCGITCLVFSSDSLLLIGCGNGCVMTFNFSRCAVGWRVSMHSGRVQAIEATDQHNASMGDDGCVILADNDGIMLFTLRCDAGWCGLKFTQARNLATVSNTGKIQLRSLSTLPPKAAESTVAWPCKLEIDVDAGGGRCTAFDIIEDFGSGRGVAVLAIGQNSADINNACDVTAVVVDLTFKVVVAKYRGPSAAITRIAFASKDWTLLPPRYIDTHRNARKMMKNESIAQVHEVGNESSQEVIKDEGKAPDKSGVACLAGVNAIIASCKDGTVRMWSPLLSRNSILLSCCGIESNANPSPIHRSSSASDQQDGNHTASRGNLTDKKGLGLMDEKSNI